MSVQSKSSQFQSKRSRETALLTDNFQLLLTVIQAQPKKKKQQSTVANALLFCFIYYNSLNQFFLKVFLCG